MTGGGKLYFSGGADFLTHGFELHCVSSDLPNNLEVNWMEGGSSHRFHLDTLASAVCSDDPTIDPNPPGATVDTFDGSGTGSFDGQPGATASWRFTDAGEPGGGDFLSIVITFGGSQVLNVSGFLQGGNHQMHC